MEMKVWMIIIYSLVALCHCAPAQVDDNAERHKRGCSSPKAQPGTVYYEGCTKFECKKKRRTFVWEETLDSGVCCIVDNKGFPVGSVIFSNSTADNCTISTLTCRNIGNLPSLVYQDQDNQCSNEELLEALEMIKKETEMNSNHTEELLVEHAKHTEELLEENASLTEDEMETIKTMLDTLLIMHTGCDQGDVTVVSGNQGGSAVSLSNLLTHDKVEYENGKYNIWNSPHKNYGAPGNFVLNLGCKMRFAAIRLVNTRSGGAWATRQFRLLTSLTQSGPWTQVLETELEDSRQQQDPLPLQVIALDTRTTAQFVRFEGISYWGVGYGLQFFDIKRN
eukprot:GFUD01016248.1.p1 GENE.GFUD01016248.1~~GFUD01016248.1.p1  ORF type:complete len:336 (+),score=61.04 GFUD01016248.1:36-1043(+)